MEERFERGVGLIGIGFDIDQEGDGRATGINAAGVFLSALFERGEVKIVESAVRLEIASFVADQEFAVGKVNVGFDAAEAVVQSIEERAGVFVIVVSVGLEKRGGIGVVGSKERDDNKQSQKLWQKFHADLLACPCEGGQLNADMEMGWRGGFPYFNDGVCLDRHVWHVCFKVVPSCEH